MPTATATLPPAADCCDAGTADTVDVVHGHQHAHHDERCFMSIQVYDC